MTKPIDAMPSISLVSIPHPHQRYETVGDWQIKPQRIEILVSRMGNRDYEFLVGLHELVEAWLCLRRGIQDADVTKFDEQFESDRKAGAHSPEAEPGDDARAPYRKEHFTATNIERIIAAELGVDWAEYERTLLKLLEPNKEKT